MELTTAGKTIPSRKGEETLSLHLGWDLKANNLEKHLQHQLVRRQELYRKFLQIIRYIMTTNHQIKGVCNQPWFCNIAKVCLRFLTRMCDHILASLQLPQQQLNNNWTTSVAIKLHMDQGRTSGVHQAPRENFSQYQCYSKLLYSTLPSQDLTSTPCSFYNQNPNVCLKRYLPIGL